MPSSVSCLFLPAGHSLQWKKTLASITIDEITARAMEALTEVMKNDFQECFQKLYKHWQTCINVQGNHSEGNVV
jgi:hypothetical protein